MEKWNQVILAITRQDNTAKIRVRVGDLSSGQEITVRQQNTGVLTDVAVKEGHDASLDGAWHAVGPGERVSLMWRHEASLILREPGADAQQEESAGKQAPVPYASKV